MFSLQNHHGDGPWTYNGAAQAIKRYRKLIGADKYDIHSLRYTAASEMALAGCTDEEIASVTGQTLETVQHYTKAVRQIANAIKSDSSSEKGCFEARPHVHKERCMNKCRDFVETLKIFDYTVIVKLKVIQ